MINKKILERRFTRLKSVCFSRNKKGNLKMSVPLRIDYALSIRRIFSLIALAGTWPFAISINPNFVTLLQISPLILPIYTTQNRFLLAWTTKLLKIQKITLGHFL